MVTLNLNHMLADAIHRKHHYLVRSIKIVIILSHLHFLKECKRRNILPRGLRVRNNLINTYPSQNATLLADRQGRQWLSLTINECYRKLRYWQKFPCAPLTQYDQNKINTIEFQLHQTKTKKMNNLLRYRNNIRQNNQYRNTHRNNIIVDQETYRHQYNIRTQQSSQQNNINNSIRQQHSDAFLNQSHYIFTERQNHLLELGPSYVPPPTKREISKATYMTNASLDSLKRQIFVHITNTSRNAGQIINIDQNVTLNAWKFINPTQRTYGVQPDLPNDINTKIDFLQHEINKLNERELKNSNCTNQTSNKTIKEIRLIENLVVVPTDKTKRLIAMDKKEYDNLYNEHLNNYEIMNRLSLPSSRQNKFNKELTTIANKQTENVKKLLYLAKCSEPIPSNMIILPKDHKEPLKGRPLVSAIDTPSTNLSKILADSMKPLLNRVSAHLRNTSEFINIILQREWIINNSTQYFFGSLDVSNLYGSIPLTGTQNVYDIVGNFFEIHKEVTILSNMSQSDFVKLLKLSTSDVTNIKGTPYKQLRGLAMGNNLSPILAIIYMDYIESRIINTNGNIILWKRYIDDIFIISTSPLDNIITVANSISENIQFTLELPNFTNTLPFLDTSVLYQPDLNSFDTSLYIKPLHSNHVLPFQSFVPMQRKIALLKSERIRALRNCSNVDEQQKALQILKKRFILNDYPVSIIDEHLLNHRTLNRVRRNNRINTNQPIIRLKFPFLSQHYANKLNKLLSNINLPVTIKPVFKTSAPLSVQLQLPYSLNCGDNCICNGRRICFVKNTVYVVTCLLCQANYIGETHRTLRSRILEHITMNTSHYNAHVKNIHDKQPCLKELDFKILLSRFGDTLQRKAAETQMIHKLKPTINIQNA